MYEIYHNVSYIIFKIFIQYIQYAIDFYDIFLG